MMRKYVKSSQRLDAVEMPKISLNPSPIRRFPVQGGLATRALVQPRQVCSEPGQKRIAPDLQEPVHDWVAKLPQPTEPTLPFLALNPARPVPLQVPSRLSFFLSPAPALHLHLGCSLLFVTGLPGVLH